MHADAAAVPVSGMPLSKKSKRADEPSKPQVVKRKSGAAPDSVERRKGDLWVTSEDPTAPLSLGATAPCGVLALLPAVQGLMTTHIRGLSVCKVDPSSRYSVQ